MGDLSPWAPHSDVARDGDAGDHPAGLRSRRLVSSMETWILNSVRCAGGEWGPTGARLRASRAWPLASYGLPSSAPALPALPRAPTSSIRPIEMANVSEPYVEQRLVRSWAGGIVIHGRSSAAAGSAELSRIIRPPRGLWCLPAYWPDLDPMGTAFPKIDMRCTSARNTHRRH